MSRGTFTAIKTEGGLLPREVLERVPPRTPTCRVSNSRLTACPERAAGRGHQPVVEPAAGAVGGVLRRAEGAGREQRRHRSHPRPLAPSAV